MSQEYESLNSLSDRVLQRMINAVGIKKIRSECYRELKCILALDLESIITNCSQILDLSNRKIAIQKDLKVALSQSNISLPNTEDVSIQAELKIPKATFGRILKEISSKKENIRFSRDVVLSIQCVAELNINNILTYMKLILEEEQRHILEVEDLLRVQDEC